MGGLLGGAVAEAVQSSAIRELECEGNFGEITLLFWS